MSSRRRGDLVHAAHLALVATLVIGRALRALGGSFSSSAPGRALALLAMLVGMTSLAAIAALTFLERRDPRLLVLAVLLVAALASRQGPDALDLVYAIAVLVLGAHWFARGRGAGTVTGTPGAPSG